MDFDGWRRWTRRVDRSAIVVFSAFQHAQDALMNANVLLLKKRMKNEECDITSEIKRSPKSTYLSLHHPRSFFPHFVHEPIDVHVLVLFHMVHDSINGNKRTRAADASAAVNYNRTSRLGRRYPGTQSTYKFHQRLRPFWHTKIWPRRKMEVTHSPRLASLKCQQSIRFQNYERSKNFLDLHAPL